MIDPTLSRRAWLGGTCALALSACSKREEPARKVPTLRVGTMKGGAELILSAAGIVPQGLKLHFDEFTSGHLAVEAFNAGALDFGAVSEIPPVFAAASSVQSFRQIAVLQGDVNNQVVLVPKGSKIESLADLKGKKVGFVRATTSQYFLIQMLKSVGLSWGDIEPIALGVPDGAAAFSQGALDAWAVYGYAIQRAVANDGARVLKTALGILSGNYLAIAHVDALADPARRTAIGEYLRCYQRGFAWEEQHSAEWARALSKEIGVAQPMVEDQLAHRSSPWRLRPVNQATIRSQQAVADTFFDAGLIPRRVDVQPLWDDRFNAVLQGAS
ncbi:MAG: ABC transporter substrate-binding protein [Polyangiales bacterium]